MSIEAHKAIIHRYVELWSTGNLALADEVLAVAAREVLGRLNNHSLLLFHGKRGNS